ncbi:PR domain zinc finger protein 16 [Pteropus alecto]|uniref:PR domain zinc finger protein 16 n=1 Tax=Pteropus alecto TaxID=9402 RepID=L5KFY0_PTEAL|nr:PR domain zinc finger protein 16 [Pteropus alecto]
MTPKASPAASKRQGQGASARCPPPRHQHRARVPVSPGVVSTQLTVEGTGDGDIVNNMYEPDPDLLAGESAEDETEDSIMSPIPMGPASPFPTSEDFTPKEGSPYEAPVYIPEDIPIPPDFELRESSIPGAGLGVWAKRRMEPGERFGPYMVAPRATLKEADFGWEVSIPVLA